MNRPMFGVLSALVLVSVCGAPLFAADGGDRSEPATLQKDPVAMAFALPKGMVLTPKEYEWAMGVRNQLEPQLRSALDRVKSAENEQEKLQAVKEVNAIRQQIKEAINTILQNRYQEAMKEAAKRAAAAREAAQKRAAQQNKNRGNKKRRR